MFVFSLMIHGENKSITAWERDLTIRRPRYGIITSRNNKTTNRIHLAHYYLHKITST